MVLFCMISKLRDIVLVTKIVAKGVEEATESPGGHLVSFLFRILNSYGEHQTILMKSTKQFL